MLSCTAIWIHFSTNISKSFKNFINIIEHSTVLILFFAIFLWILTLWILFSFFTFINLLFVQLLFHIREFVYFFFFSSSFDFFTFDFNLYLCFVFFLYIWSPLLTLDTECLKSSPARSDDSSKASSKEMDQGIEMGETKSTSCCISLSKRDDTWSSDHIGIQ